jgi:pilus assembly protein Flp/PilA
MSVYTIKALKRFIKSDEGVTAIEYGLIAALIAVVIISAVYNLSNNLQDTFNTIATAVQDATS